MARPPILTREQVPPELHDAFDAETANSSGNGNAFEVGVPDGADARLSV